MPMKHIVHGPQSLAQTGCNTLGLALQRACSLPDPIPTIRAGHANITDMRSSRSAELPSYQAPRFSLPIVDVSQPGCPSGLITAKGICMEPPQVQQQRRGGSQVTRGFRRTLHQKDWQQQQLQQQGLQMTVTGTEDGGYIPLALLASSAPTMPMGDSWHTSSAAGATGGNVRTTAHQHLTHMVPQDSSSQPLSSSAAGGDARTKAVQALTHTMRKRHGDFNNTETCGMWFGSGGEAVQPQLMKRVRAGPTSCSSDMPMHPTQWVSPGAALKTPYPGHSLQWCPGGDHQVNLLGFGSTSFV
jgi:hypothetical protein